MPTNVIMPQLGESVAEGTVTKWLKKVGDRVERDEPLFEVSTDKVDAEVPSPAAGLLTGILVQESETVVVNTVVAVIDGERAAAPPRERGANKAHLDEASGQEPSRIPTNASPASSAPAFAAPGGAASAGSAQSVPDPQVKIRSSPLVRRIAQEHQIDLNLVKGTGLGGRIGKKDILAYLPEARRASAQGPASPVAAPLPSSSAPVPSIHFDGPTHAVPMTPMRRQIAEHMVASQRTSAHVTTVFEVEMTRVVEARERSAEEFERRNSLKLTYTPFFARAVVEALKEFPALNASVDGTNVIYKRDVNIGIAVALENGLIVPVIKRASEKDFLDIARAVQDLAERARTKRLSVEEVQGGTFTVTNPGVFGSLLGTPIIHQPQVAILGIGAIEKRPVVRNDAIAIRSMAYLTLSFDHRIIDGAAADQFMGRIKRQLENWGEPVL